jgi:hypothetical protein
MAHGQGHGPEPAGLEVHAVARLPCDERVDDLDDAGGDGELRLLRGGADMVGSYDVRVLGDRGLPLRGAGAGFVPVDVQARAHRTSVERLEQGGLVDDLAAGGVEQDRAGAHVAEERLVDQVPRLR